MACGFFLHAPDGCDKVLLQSEGLHANSGSLQVVSKGKSVEPIGLGRKEAARKEVVVGTTVPKP